MKVLSVNISEEKGTVKTPVKELILNHSGAVGEPILLPHFGSPTASRNAPVDVASEHSSDDSLPQYVHVEID